ncbi:TPA: hypothetical protein ACH3X3_000489 [Trebouxia sp. C0006]
MLPAVCPQSSPDKCLLVMGPDSPSGNHGVAQHAQQPDHSWQQRTETHAPSGPVSDLSPETCELLMDLDSEPEEHESAQLEQQHRHTTWQQPRNSEPSLGPASCHAESSATHSLMDMDTDPYVARFSDPEEDHQLQQQQQKQQQHWQLQHDRSQQQHEHEQQQVQASVAGSCIPIVFDDYEEEPDFVPDPGVFSPDLKQNQPQHAQHAQRDVQSDGHDQPQQWDAEEEQWQLQHPGSNITAATPAAAAADATHGKHSQTPPTTLLHTANAEPMQMAKSTAASLQYDQYRSQQIREAAESRPQTNSCPFVFGFEQEKEVGSQAMAESSADKEEEAWQLQESGSGKQLHQQLPVAMQGISHRLHAQLQAAQDQCPLVFDIESDEEDGHRSSMGTQPDHAGLDQGAIVSTAGHTGNSHPSADSAGQLSNSPRGDAPPELFRQSPYDLAVSGQFRQSPHNPAVSGQVRQSPHDPAVSGQFRQSLHDTAVSEQFRPSSYDPAVSGHFRQSPPAWDSVPDVHRSTVQMQTGFEDRSQQHDQDVSHGQAHDRSSHDQLHNNGDQTEISPDEAYCPIVFGLESEEEERSEGAEPPMAEDICLPEHADVDMMSEDHEVEEWSAPGQDLAPLMVTHQPDVKKRSRIRDELFQGLMKVRGMGGCNLWWLSSLRQSTKLTCSLEADSP